MWVCDNQLTGICQTAFYPTKKEGNHKQYHKHKKCSHLSGECVRMLCHWVLVVLTFTDWCIFFASHIRWALCTTTNMDILLLQSLNYSSHLCIKGNWEFDISYTKKYPADVLLISSSITQLNKMVPHGNMFWLKVIPLKSPTIICVWTTFWDSQLIVFFGQYLYTTSPLGSSEYN